MQDNDEFTQAGTVSVSPDALNLARQFAETIGAMKSRSQVVTFDWATSLITHEPGKPDCEVGPCLLLGAYRRSEVPATAIARVNGLEFVIQIPADVLARCPLKRIDLDDSKPFRLGLS